MFVILCRNDDDDLVEIIGPLTEREAELEAAALGNGAQGLNYEVHSTITAEDFWTNL